MDLDQQAIGASPLDNLYGVGFDGDQWLAVGRGGRILTSPDGVTWSPKTSGTTEDLWAVGVG